MLSVQPKTNNRYVGRAARVAVLELYYNCHECSGDAAHEPVNSEIELCPMHQEQAARIMASPEESPEVRDVIDSGTYRTSANRRKNIAEDYISHADSGAHLAGRKRTYKQPAAAKIYRCLM